MTATAQQLEYLKNSIKSIQDYPKPGILFRDVTSLLEDPKAYALSIDLLVERYKNAGITKVVGTEARGFLFGAPVALGLGVGFVPVRKPGKLPRETISETYDLEYPRLHSSLSISKIASKAFRTTQNPAFFSAMSPAYWKTRKLTLSASTCWLSVTKMRALPKLSAPKRVASCLALR